jgi:hypothetical protein
MHFNQPPNWPPAPPGWTPPAGWVPDPSWPPPPPGWRLWVPEPSSSATRRRTLLAAALAVALLIGVGVIAIGATSVHSVAGTPTRQPGPPPSDEDLVRAVVDRFEQTWNAEDFDALSELLCEEMRNDPQFDRTLMSEMRSTSGTLTLTVAELVIEGDEATATVLNEGLDPDDIDFTRENGEWKWCAF